MFTGSILAIFIKILLFIALTAILYKDQHYIAVKLFILLAAIACVPFFNSLLYGISIGIAVYKVWRRPKIQKIGAGAFLVLILLVEIINHSIVFIPLGR